MKLKTTITGLAFAALAASASADEKCDKVAAEVKKLVKEDATKVLVIIDEKIAENLTCACEIVKSAIEASDADKDLVKDIVMTAASSAPEYAATIAECAIAVKPEAATAIRAGLDEVFEGAKAGVSAKQPVGAKAPVDPKEPVVVEDFGPTPVVVSGVYLIAPSSPSAPVKEVVEVIRRKIVKTKEPRGRTTPSPQTP